MGLHMPPLSLIATIAGMAPLVVELLLAQVVHEVPEVSLEDYVL